MHSWAVVEAVCRRRLQWVRVEVAAGHYHCPEAEVAAVVVLHSWPVAEEVVVVVEEEVVAQQRRATAEEVAEAAGQRRGAFPHLPLHFCYRTLSSRIGRTCTCPRNPRFPFEFPHP